MTPSVSGEHLVAVVQELSLARDIDTIVGIVRTAARQLTGADGATFILREDDRCHYVDEDAIGPLWKGQRFPMAACISGWVMLNRQPAAIEDIFVDSRIPLDAYRATFVKSLVMVPVRSTDPIAAIGNYWAAPHRASAAEVEILQALANSTAVAIENVRVYQELEQRVAERTAQLEYANLELDAFAYSVSHDLRAPLRHLSGFAHLLAQAGNSVEAQRKYAARIDEAAQRMTRLVDDLLEFSRLSRAPLDVQRFDLSDLVAEARRAVMVEARDREIDWFVGPLPAVIGDRSLLFQAMFNLLSNAVKYTRGRSPGAIEVGHYRETTSGEVVVYVRDNGAGFDMQYAGKLFGVFQRLHGSDEFEGTGVGLANVRRIVSRHGGRTWAEGVVDAGATFYVSLPVTELTPAD